MIPVSWKYNTAGDGLDFFSSLYYVNIYTYIQYV